MTMRSAQNDNTRFHLGFLTVNRQDLILVDGGVVMNQPLSNLVEQECGTIYACAVGSTAPLAPPQNLIDNALRSVNLAMHPEVFVPADNFDFTPEIVRSVMAEAEAKTLAWLDENHPE